MPADCVRLDTLACRWIRHAGTQPPTAFAALLAETWVSDEERRMIAALEAAKAVAGEGERASLLPAVRGWMDEELRDAQAAATQVRNAATLQTAELDRLMVETVSAAAEECAAGPAGLNPSPGS